MLFYCCCGEFCRPASLGFRYPKRLRIGCFWLEIGSKLHERLINGLFLSALYLTLYIYVSHEIVEDGCPTDSDYYWECITALCKKSLATIALCCYVPSMAYCLWNVSRLDAVLGLRADIRTNGLSQEL